MDYFLTVYQPIKASPGPRFGELVAHVLRVTIDKDLAWLKRNADEIVRRYGLRDYCALWVSDADEFCSARIGS